MWFRTEPGLRGCRALLGDPSNTLIHAAKLVWNAVGSEVSGAGTLDTKVAIVRRRDDTIFAKRRSICPGARNNNKEIRRWRHPDMSQTRHKFKQIR